jgi:hypothetical protein
MVRPPRAPADLQAQTRFVKETCDCRARANRAAHRSNLRLAERRHTEPLAGGVRNRQCLHRNEVSLVALKFSRRP